MHHLQDATSGTSNSTTERSVDMHRRKDEMEKSNSIQNTRHSGELCYQTHHQNWESKKGNSENIPSSPGNPLANAMTSSFL